jgi:GTP-binding protein
MFIDKAEIYVRSGKGGDGSMSFRREKYVPNGGPDGGDGGKGGDVILMADASVNSLTAFRFKKSFHAENGEPGGAYRRSGKGGEDIVIKVPIGTVVFDNETSHMMFDFIEDGQTFVAARGGRGGQGNQHYATSTRQAPKFAKPGDEAEEKTLLLELKIIADVGLIGFPNVGKSTLLSRVTNARPKIADYHFTTLSPNLGMVRYKNAQEFVMADIPGLIEGANEGMGLGHEFLRHIERTRLLVHVIDASGSEHRDPKEDFDIINNELFSYSLRLKDLRQIIVLNKCDLMRTKRRCIT